MSYVSAAAEAAPPSSFRHLGTGFCVASSVRTHVAAAPRQLHYPPMMGTAACIVVSRFNLAQVPVFNSTRPTWIGRGQSGQGITSSSLALLGRHVSREHVALKALPQPACGSGSCGCDGDGGWRPGHLGEAGGGAPPGPRVLPPGLIIRGEHQMLRCSAGPDSRRAAVCEALKAQGRAGPYARHRR